MRARRPWVVAFVASLGAAVAIACGSSSEDTSGGADAASDGSDATTSGGDGSGDDASGGGDVTGDTTGDVGDAGSSDASDGDARQLDAAFVFDGDADTPVIVHQLAAGGGHSCAIRGGGTVKCWGWNSKGQLGNGADAGGTSGPVDVVGLTDAVEITAGNAHTCARRAGGTVRCWGDGKFLGTGADAGTSSTPVDVTGLSDAVQISAGSYHTCALRSNHHVVCWGDNYGRIGDGTTTDRLTPTEPLAQVDAGPDAGVVDDAVAIGTGWGHTCIVHENGAMTCSGEYNAWGQIGDGTNQDRYTPVRVQNLSTAVDVGLGCYTSCARLVTGQIQCWGNNQAGQLGQGFSDQNVNGAPINVPGMTQAKEISGACFGICALTQGLKAYCWGDYVGTGPSPSQVVTSGPVAEVVGGEEHACARLVSGDVQCWGSNYFGQIGSSGDAGVSPSSPFTVPGL